MKSVVYFGSARQARWEAAETLPCKLDLILERLRLRERVRNEYVAIKMHLGGHVGYSTVHPVFVRRVVRAVLDGGGKPFVCDTSQAALTAHERGYTAETIGCPIFPVAGPDERYFYTYRKRYKNIRDWGLGGHIEDATFLIDLAHVKGHPSCGFGGAIKNLALGAMITETRSAIHDTFHHNPYWLPEKRPDRGALDAIIRSCPFEAVVRDKHDPTRPHLHMEQCNQCGRCAEAGPDGAFRVQRVNFRSFQEACAISTKIALDTFEPKKRVFLNVAEHITPLCDCFGFTGAPVLTDLGVLGADDIVAIDQATLDLLAPLPVMAENLPACMEVQPNAGHPFQQIHGPYKDPYIAVRACEKLGLGSRDYQIVDVMPMDASRRPAPPLVGAAAL